MKLISWTGWTKEDWRDAVDFFAKLLGASAWVLTMVLMIIVFG